MYRVALVKPVPNSPVSTNGEEVQFVDLTTGYYQIMAEYTNYSAAKASADFYNLAILTTQSKAFNNVFKYVVYDTDSPLYNVRGVSNKESYGGNSSGYFGVFGNMIPFEIAVEMCNYYNSRYPITAEDYQLNEHGEVKNERAISLVYFIAGEAVV